MRGQCILRAKQNVASEAHETSTRKAPRIRATSTVTSSTALREGYGGTFVFHWVFAIYPNGCPERQRKLIKRLTGRAGTKQGTGKLNACSH